MPTDEPQVGEVWGREFDGRPVVGVVADVSDMMITLVSMTGNRLRLAPDRVRSDWYFSSPAPVTNVSCTRCSQPGILTYDRPGGPDYVCPRHLPQKVVARLNSGQSAIIPEGRSELHTQTVPCPNCQDAHPIETLPTPPMTRSRWQCRACTRHWVVIEQDPQTTYSNDDSNARWLAAEIGQQIEQARLDKQEIQHVMAGRRAMVLLVIQPPPGPPVELLRSLPEDMVLILGTRTQVGPIQRLGGQPDRAGTVGEPPRFHPLLPPVPIIKVEPEPPPFHVGDEWLDVHSDAAYLIEYIDVDKRVVRLSSTSGRRAERISFADLSVPTAWRPVVRRTAFDWIDSEDE